MITRRRGACGCGVTGCSKYAVLGVGALAAAAAECGTPPALYRGGRRQDPSMTMWKELRWTPWPCCQNQNAAVALALALRQRVIFLSITLLNLE